MNNIIFIVCVAAVLVAALFITFKESIHISDTQYDRLLFFAKIFCPAFVVFITTVSECCHIACGTAVAGVVAAIGLFITALTSKANQTWKGISDADLQIAKEMDPDYIGERFYTDAEGNLLKEDEDE